MQINWNDADMLLRLINMIPKDDVSQRAQEARALGGRIIAAFPGALTEMFPDLV